MVHDWEKTRCCGGGVARYGEDTLLLRKHTVTENTCCTLRRKRDVMERHVVKETEAIDPLLVQDADNPVIVCAGGSNPGRDRGKGLF